MYLLRYELVKTFQDGVVVWWCSDLVIDGRADYGIILSIDGILV